MTLYLQLFWEFFKTGLFAVGGGMATLPFLYDISNKTGWFTHAQLADMVAVSESTPGPIGVNMASYVGFVTGGVGGVLTWHPWKHLALPGRNAVLVLEIASRNLVVLKYHPLEGHLLLRRIVHRVVPLE